MLRIIVLLGCISLCLSTLVIKSPLVTDFPNNTIDYFYANFGEIPYGKTLSFDLLVLDNSLCQPVTELDHLQKPTYLVIKTNSFDSCSYTKRALTAQAIGAKGLLVASAKADYAKTNVIQSDDGNGKKVHISCLHITNDSFEKIKKINKLDKSSEIEVVANFPVPQEKTATVSIFLSASKRSTYVFLREFKKDYAQLKSYITLEPIYHTIDCGTCHQDNCYFSYCCFDYQNRVSNVGQKIIKQQLHQLAIFNKKGAEKWFQYMNLFDKYCDGNWNYIDQCTKNVLKKMNTDDVYNSDPLSTLSFWRTQEALLGFDGFPQVAINKMIYRGNLNSTDITDAICASLITPPKYCENRTVAVQVPTNKTNSHVVIILLVTIVALILLIILSVCLYKKFIKSELTKDMTSRVGEIVANYANKITTQKKRHKEKLIETFDEEL